MSDEDTQNPEPSTPPAPAPIRNGCAGKGILIALGILLFIIAICVVIVVTVIGLGVHRAVREVSNRNVVKVAVGQSAGTGDLSIMVNGWQPSRGDEMTKPGPGNQFIVVDLSITNNDTGSKSVSTLAQMSIRTPSGYDYSQAAYFPEPKFPDGDILPGQTARGKVAFEVPANIGTMRFVYEPILLGDTVEVKLK